MNTKDNKRHQETLQRIYTAFAALLRDQELKKISVTELCEMANIERSTFYANFEGISALANSYAAEIEKQVAAQPHTEGEFDWIFDFIKDNYELFDAYFKIGVCGKGKDYKEIFFRNGVYGIVRLWFESGCEESSQAMGKIVMREYLKIVN